MLWASERGKPISSLASGIETWASSSLPFLLCVGASAAFVKEMPFGHDGVLTWQTGLSILVAIFTQRGEGSALAAIEVSGLRKVFRNKTKEPGLRGSLQALLRPTYTKQRREGDQL